MAAETVRRADLVVRPPFSDLFRIDAAKLADIAAHMREHGYDFAEGIDVWDKPDEGLVVVDGHTRLTAAARLAIEDVPVNRYAFADQLAALTHAYHKQKDRRNLTSAEIMRAVPIVDQERRESRGGNRNPDGANQYTGEVNLSIDRLTSPKESAKETAAIVGVSPASVYRARVIADDPIAVAEVAAGRGLIGAAADARDRRRESRPAVIPLPEPTPLKPEPDWRRASDLGHAAETAAIVACNRVTELLAEVERDGIDLPALMQDRRVSARWNGAIAEANRLAGMIRSAIRGG